MRFLLLLWIPLFFIRYSIVKDCVLHCSTQSFVAYFPRPKTSFFPSQFNQWWFTVQIAHDFSSQKWRSSDNSHNEIHLKQQSWKLKTSMAFSCCRMDEKEAMNSNCRLFSIRFWLQFGAEIEGAKTKVLANARENERKKKNNMKIFGTFYGQWIFFIRIFSFPIGAVILLLVGAHG